MLYSMTGFGRAESNHATYQILVDIKSLNGKQSEINIRIPLLLKSYEIDIRNIINSELTRGNIEINIQLKQNGAPRPMKVNTELATYYYQSLVQVSKEINQPINDALPIIMAMPEVITQSSDEMEEGLWEAVKDTMIQACKELKIQRRQEGQMLQNYIVTNTDKILEALAQVPQYEEERITKQKEKLELLLNEYVGTESKDNVRLEQEIIFYIEKLDISEEKSRLLHHCNYFKEIIEDSEITKGKRLGFVLQEIGREINTLGSKANHAAIQRLVVQMKDELEKAKEQTLNVL